MVRLWIPMARNHLVGQGRHQVGFYLLKWVIAQTVPVIPSRKAVSVSVAFSGNLVFEDDQWLEGIHAVFSFIDGQLVVRDLTSLRGTWRLLQSEEDFPPGTELLVGAHRVILEL